MKFKVGDVLFLNNHDFKEIVKVIEVKTTLIVLNIIKTNDKGFKKGDIYHQVTTDINNYAIKLTKKDLESVKLLYF